MRFLIRVANRAKYEPKDARGLASSCYKALREYGADVGNLRVSRTAIELDLLLPSPNNLQAATAALERKVGPLLTVRELDTINPQTDESRAIREGIEFFNEERYWESHEALEAAWRKAKGPEKEILQGIILIAAAFVHLQKNENDVALGVMKRAHEKLAPHHALHFGVDIDDLKETVSAMLSRTQLEFFRIQAKPYTSDATA